jgi:hypothetical protein
LSEAESELRDKKDVIKLTRQRAEEAQNQIKALQLEKVGWIYPLCGQSGTDFARLGIFLLLL